MAAIDKLTDKGRLCALVAGVAALMAFTFDAYAAGIKFVVTQGQPVGQRFGGKKRHASALKQPSAVLESGNLLIAPSGHAWGHGFTPFAAAVTR